ncbi:MAG: hypothetical protein WCO56_23075 [Verrucomicrobiota bacterium]
MANHILNRISPAKSLLVILVTWSLNSLMDSIAADSAPAGFKNFITRQGNKLYDGDKEFRFVGANMPGLNLPYDWTLSLPERLVLPTPWEQEAAFQTLSQMNLKVVRLWNLPIRDPKTHAKDGPLTWHYVQAPGKFNEESFKVCDHLLALANRYGVRVIFSLTAESGDYLGGIGTYADWRGKKREAFYTDPQLKADYQATVRYVLERTNTVTDVPYREDKAILAWQFGNEMHSAKTAWLAEMAAFIKQLDRNHLVSETRHRPGAPLEVDPNIDLYTRHYYPNYPGVEDGWAASCRREFAKLDGQRPMFIGEWGPYIDDKMFTHANVVDKVREFLEYLRSEPGISGSCIWSMYFPHREGGFYWHQIMTYKSVWSYHWPGFPSADAQREIGVMSAMREAAYAIEGKPIPPVPRPEAPELLPCAEIPMLTWRIGVGASMCEVQRAPHAAGPWTTIATNVYDGDVAYRPLFSDNTARSGETYFYRVAARNDSGISAPSNVIGPVRVNRVCMVDELQDFSRAHSRSPQLQLNNDFNALYAEYMFRARGSTNDWIIYQVPGMTAIKVTAFYKDPWNDISFEVSPDGKSYIPLPADRKENRLPSPPRGATVAQQRTLVEYEAPVPAGQQYLKILWKGPAELDRVEVFHSGGK